MTQPIAALRPVATAGSTPLTTAAAAPGGARAVDKGFLHNLDKALLSVSTAQRGADTQARALVAGAPGASLEAAVVASQRAKVDWNATVAVRNEVVNAYRTIMNMPV